MGLSEELKDITAAIKRNRSNFETHHKLFDIYEGNLGTHVDQWIRSQLGPKSYEYARQRISPINVLRKLVDKLSCIYQQDPMRFVKDGTDMDSELLKYYEDKMSIDQVMNTANEFFNMNRATLIQPFVHKGKPQLRAIPNDRFFVWSNDDVNPMNPTHVMTFSQNPNDRAETIIQVYTDEELLICNQDGAVDAKLMRQMELDGSNPMGIIPFVYVNRSLNLLSPCADNDSLKLTLLIAGLLTDLNYASMFSLFSIMFGIDVNNENLDFAPNAFWQFYSDDDGEKKPQIGQLKPEADVSSTLELIRSQLAFWMQTRNIRAGAIGDLETSNFASGISKMIDEADTTEDRERQITYFQKAESELWYKITKYLHPYWVSRGEIDGTNSLFSPMARIETSFPQQLPVLRRGDLVRDLRDEIDSGFMSKKRAIMKLNPRMSKDEVDELIKEIDEETMLRIPAMSDQGNVE